MPAIKSAQPADDSVRLHAYHLWEQDGSPHGRDLEFWQRAKDMLTTSAKPRRAAGAAAPKASKSAPVKLSAKKPG